MSAILLHMSLWAGPHQALIGPAYPPTRVGDRCVVREYGVEREEVVLAVEYKAGGLVLVDVGRVKGGRTVPDRVIKLSPDGVYQLSDPEFGQFPQPLPCRSPAHPPAAVLITSWRSSEWAFYDWTLRGWRVS